MSYAGRKQTLQKMVQEKIGYQQEYSDEDVKEMIDEVILSQQDLSYWPVEQRLRLKRELFFSMRRLDVLQLFVEDRDVTEIMINGMEHIFLEKHGQIEELDAKFDSEEKLHDVIQQIVSSCNRVVNEASPIVDARLRDGSRVSCVLPPVALNGPIVTIRRFPDKPITMDWLVRKNSISAGAAAFLAGLVQAGYNIFVSGGTGSGKTTFLNALSAYIPASDRVITIEDDAELQLQGLPNLVRLETRNNPVEGCKEVTIRELIRASLRMRPTRIIVGEVRGAEAFDMLQCMNTGHDGSMSTGHANSGRDMLGRIENMVLCAMELPLHAIRRQIASGIDIVVHLGRLRDRSRRVLEILEVTGMEDGEIRTDTLYEFRETGVDNEGNILGELEEKEKLGNRGKLDAAGLSQL